MNANKCDCWNRTAGTCAHSGAAPDKARARPWQSTNGWRVSVRDPHTPEWKWPRDRNFSTELKAKAYAENIIGCAVGCQPEVTVYYRALSTDGYHAVYKLGAYGLEAVSL